MKRNVFSIVTIVTMGFYLSWFVLRVSKLTDAPKSDFPSVSVASPAIRKYLYGVPLNPRR